MSEMQQAEESRVKVGEDRQTEREEKTENKRNRVDLFTRNRVQQPHYELSFIPSGVLQGQRIVKFRFMDRVDEAEKWKNALVSSVFGSSPKFQGMERFAMNKWNRYGLIFVKFVKENVFLF